VSWVEQCLAGTSGPVLAASDYVSAVADLIRPYVPRRYVALGTDGFGRSDTRAALRAFFEVDAAHLAHAALAELDAGLAARALDRYRIDGGARPPWDR
jgi:pyruvate dehydrogenase E1 component